MPREWMVRPRDDPAVAVRGPLLAEEGGVRELVGDRGPAPLLGEPPDPGIGLGVELAGSLQVQHQGNVPRRAVHEALPKSLPIFL